MEYGTVGIDEDMESHRLGFKHVFHNLGAHLKLMLMIHLPSRVNEFNEIRDFVCAVHWCDPSTSPSVWHEAGSQPIFVK